MPYFGPQVGITPIRPLDYSPITNGVASIGHAFAQMDARRRADAEIARQQEQIDLQKNDQAMRAQMQAASLAQMGFVSGDQLGDEIRQAPMPGVQVAQPALSMPGPTAAPLPKAMPAVQVSAPQPSAVMRLTQGAPATAAPAPAASPVDATFARLRSAMGGPQKVAMGDAPAMYYDPARAAMRQMAPDIAKEGMALERLSQERARQRSDLLAAGVPPNVVDAALDNPALQAGFIGPKSEPSKDAQIQKRITELVGQGVKLEAANRQARLEAGEQNQQDPSDHFSVTTAVGPDGTPVIAVVNTNTGEVRATDVGKPVGSGGSGGTTGAQTPVTDMVQRLDEIKGHVADLRAGKWKITPNMPIREGLSYGTALDNAAGHPAVGKMAAGRVMDMLGAGASPDFARFQALMNSQRAFGDDAAKAFKGRQNEQSVLREIVLAQLTPDDWQNPQVVDQKLTRMQHIIDMASVSQPKGPANPGTAKADGTTTKPPLAERVQQLKAEGKTKEQARAILAQEGYSLAGVP